MPNQYNYSIPGFDVAAILFRNLEIVLSGATGSQELDLDFTAHALDMQARAFAVLHPLHLAPTPDTSGPPILHLGRELIIPSSIMGGPVQLGYNDTAAVYYVRVPGQRVTFAPSRSYSIEPLPTDLIAQATLYDHTDDALLNYFHAQGWSVTPRIVPHPAITGERAFWVDYSKAPRNEQTNGGAYARFVYRNLSVVVEWDVPNGKFDGGVLRHVLRITAAVVDQLRQRALHT